MKHRLPIALLALFFALAGFMTPAKAARIPVVKNGSSTSLKGTIVKIKYAGQNVLSENVVKQAPSVKIGSTIYAPCRTLFSDNGIHAKYSASKGKVTLTYGKRKVVFYNNKNYATVNGMRMSLVKSSYFVTFKKSSIRDMLVPVRQAAAFLGLKYSYNSKKKTVTLRVREGIHNTATRAKSVSKSEFIETVGPLAQANYKRTGILASVTMAQAILESGWGQSYLAENGNNLFGMKKNLSGNAWADSAWDGVNYRTKGGAQYRKYSCIEDSIEDHSAYLLGAMSGGHKRYGGLTSTSSYKKQLTIIKSGGYCTSGSYVSQLCSVISRYHLTRWDKK